MLTFSGGPADGVTLDLGRAPLFLRVVVGPGGVDALDQLDDAPSPAESISVYRRNGEVGRVHLQMAGPGGRGRRCRWELCGEYAFMDEQPDDATLRDQASWREWATARANNPE